MIRVHAEAVRSTSSAVAEKPESCLIYKMKKVVNAMVELDQMKQELQTYESPLAEVRDSL